MIKLRRQHWLYIILFLLLIGTLFFLPLSSKDHVSYCTSPPDLKTRYTIFEKNSYDKVITEYNSPGSETMDCVGVVTKLHLYLL